MKKLVLAVLALGAVAACTKSAVQYEQPGEISLQPVAQKATKATVDGTTYPEELNFKVWSWWGNPEAGTAASAAFSTPYINAGEFCYNEDKSSWGGVTPYYWPTKGSLVFAGYSPASADGTFNYSLETKTFTVTNYVQSSNIAETKDLMWFDVTDVSHNQNGTSGVPVTFKHALSWLTFDFVLNSDITTHKWEITEVELQPVSTKASFSATKSDPNAGTWSSFAGDKSSMIVYKKPTGSSEVLYLSTTAKRYEDAENGVVVIPQSCVNLLVKYNLTASTGNVISQEVELGLNAGDDGNSWLPGKHYVYSIVFGANEILVSPQIADWEDVPGGVTE